VLNSVSKTYVNSSALS